MQHSEKRSSPGRPRPAGGARSRPGCSRPAATPPSCADECGVGHLVEEAVGLAGVRRGHPEEPGAPGVLVDEAGVVGQLVVDGRHDAAQRGPYFFKWWFV